MTFDDRYDLLNLLDGDSERKTYSAREKSTRREVLLHLLVQKPGQPSELISAAERYLATEPGAASKLQIGTFQNQSCLITAGTEFRNIRQVLLPASTGDPFGKVQMWKVPVVKEQVNEPATGSGVGEFTQMFSQPVAPPVTPAASQAPAAAPSQTDPGEFTRMFSQPVSPPPPAPPAAPAPTEPGEFTRMFQTTTPQPARPGPPVEPKAPPLQTPAPPASDGSFTQMFSNAPVKSEPSEFTGLFRSDSAPPPPKPAEKWIDLSPPPQPNLTPEPNAINMNLSGSKAATGAAGATGAFEARSVPTVQPAAQEGPSEFTRLIAVRTDGPAEVKAAAPASEAAAPAQSAQTESPAPKKSYLPIIIILNVLFLAAIALVLYFLMRK